MKVGHMFYMEKSLHLVITFGVFTIARANNSAVALSTYLDINKEKARKLQERIKHFCGNCNATIKPGQKWYSKTYSLSLVRSVLIMNQNGEELKRECWSGTTDKSNMA